MTTFTRTTDRSALRTSAMYLGPVVTVVALILLWQVWVTAAGIKPFYGPFGDFADPQACEAQFRNAFLLGCAGAWTLHPSQIEIAKRVFSPDPEEVVFARRILEAMPDGSGAVMIDGKMQDDATWKQAKVIVDLARQVAARDPALAERYGL